MKKIVIAIVLSGTLQAWAQEPLTSIPFELYGDHIFVKASVDDSPPLDMIFDTGSGVTVIDRNIADTLDKVKHHVTLNEGMVRSSLIKHNKISINGFDVEKNIKVYSTDLHHLEMSIGREFDGIVGYDFMKHHDVRINYNEQILEVYDVGEGPHLGDVIPFRLVHHIPVVDGNVILNNDEAHEGSFFLMTGAGTTLDFNAPYAEKYDVIHKTGDHYSYYIMSISDVESLEYEGFIKSLTFGQQDITDLPISISQAQTGIHSHPDVSGIIGNKMLKKYNITYDYKNKELHLMKNHHYSEPYTTNCSGFDIQMSRDMKNVLVHQVFEEGPAADAGMKIDSELVSFNGMTMDAITIPEIRALMTQPGETVEVVVRENGTEKTYSLTLRALL